MTASRSFVFALLLAPAAAAAQARPATGRIVGRVIDAASGQGISDAGVQVVGTTVGVMSGLEGRFTVPSVPAGTVTIQVRRIGFAPKTITGLMLAAGETLEQNVSLSAAVIALSAQVVTAAAERGTVSEALDEQRTATGIVNSVTREQIARSPDSDAAQAVQRVSGVTVQDGRYVFVRGLGERYTTTSLNGARLPSPEPERKVVPLDLFPSGLLQSITTSKTFTPDLPGDFSGALVDIRTREFPGRRQVAFSTTVGMNTTAFDGELPIAPGVGGERFALAGSARELPAGVRAAGNLTTPVPQAEENALIRSFRPTWGPDLQSGTPNTSFSASVGGSDPVFGQRIGYLVSGTYSYGQDVKNNATRGLARGTAGGEYNRFTGTGSGVSALLGGMANFSALLGARTRLSFNNTYNRTSDNTATTERGIYEEFQVPVQVEVLNYVERSVRSSQLAGEHELGRQQLEWSATSSGVTRDQPDRSEFVREIVTPDGGGAERLLWFSSIPEGAARTFAELDENTLEGRLDYQLRLGAPERQLQLKVGGLARDTDREADTRAFGIVAAGLSEDERALSTGELFGPRFLSGDNAAFELRSLSQGGAYAAADRNLAGYLMADAPLSTRLRFIGGARVEDSRVTVTAIGTLGDEATTERNFTDLLPSAALNFKPTESQNVRLSVSRTLARPEYRELAALRTRDVLGGVDARGNPDLVRTLIDNADVRWEWYPSSGEIVSAAVFAKRFDRPIERVFRPASSGSLVTYINAEGAENLGVEFELRKNLGFVLQPLSALTAFSNVTLMRSEVRLGDAEGSATDKDRPMVGQAPYVVNAGLTYVGREGRLSATLLYNRVGERIAEAGESSLPDVKERPRDVMDLSLRFPLLGAVSGRFDARNLYDAPYERRQGSVVRESYRAGRIFQFGVSWQP